jgi:transposase
VLRGKEEELPNATNPATICAGIYRRRIVELARAGRSFDQLARELEPTPTRSGKSVKQAALDEGLRGDSLTTTEREELTPLGRENRVLCEERLNNRTDRHRWAMRCDGSRCSHLSAERERCEDAGRVERLARHLSVTRS